MRMVRFQLKSILVYYVIGNCTNILIGDQKMRSYQNVQHVMASMQIIEIQIVYKLSFSGHVNEPSINSLPLNSPLWF